MTIAYPIVGIDIAKDKHDLVILHEDGSNRAWVIDGDDTSLQDCAASLAKTGVKLVVLEATGGYELPFMLALDAAGIQIARVNPMRVREFAKGIGQMSKTDREDALLLAIYGERVRPAGTTVQRKKQRQLKELCQRRRQLVEARAKEKTRLKQARAKVVQRSIAKQIVFCGRQIDAIESAIEKLIESDAELAQMNTLVTSYPGIGKVTAFSILADLPELGQCGHRQLNALVGVAPFNNDSAKRQGQRHIRGGRFDLRRALYMGAQTGYRHNPTLKALYDRLRKKQRSHKCAIVACINKMLKTLNAMAKSGVPFSPDHVNA